MEMKVNHLPVLTWNQLKLNHASLNIDTSTTLTAQEIGCKSTELPEGIVLEEKIRSEILQERFRELGISNPREKFVAGKFPIYNSQTFATGMGGEVDDFMVQAGAATNIYTIENGYRSEEPVLIRYEYPLGVSGLSRIFFHAKAGTESTFILQYTSEKDDATDGKTISDALIGVQTYLYLEEGAKVHFHVVQMLDKSYTFFHDIGGFSREKSALTLTKLDLGATTVYEGLNEIQMGDKSDFSSDLGYIGLAGSKMDINYNDVFWGRKANGRMYFKEALLDDAQKTFRGTVDFRQYSKGSNGDEQEDIILLGDDVVNKTIPLILCEEEDVEGRHASTIGSLSEDMLFYMQTRGIGKRKAEELMVRASITHISQMIPSEEIRKEVKQYICKIFV